MGTKVELKGTATTGTFTLHSGQMRTYVRKIPEEVNLKFTLHSGQMGTEGVKLFIIIIFLFSRRGRFSATLQL